MILDQLRDQKKWISSGDPAEFENQAAGSQLGRVK